jgi:ketosteroid isomerase-like protein
MGNAKLKLPSQQTCNSFNQLKKISTSQKSHTMNRWIIAIVFSFGCFLLSAQPEKEIQQILEQQLKAWNAGDIDGFMAHYWKSDSLRFMTKTGVTLGWQPTLDRYKKGYPDRASMGKLDFQIYTIELLSKRSAMVTGKWAIESNKSQSGSFNLLLKKKDKHWVIVLDHTS